MEEIKAQLEAARLQVRSLARACRTTGQVLASLEEELDGLLETQGPEEDAAHEYNGSRKAGRLPA